MCKEDYYTEFIDNIDKIDEYSKSKCCKCGIKFHDIYLEYIYSSKLDKYVVCCKKCKKEV